MKLASCTHIIMYHALQCSCVWTTVGALCGILNLSARINCCIINSIIIHDDVSGVSLMSILTGIRKHAQAENYSFSACSHT